MALGKQAKILTRHQINAVLAFVEGTRQSVRNRVIFLLSVRAGLRSKEIASLTWTMICDATGNVGDAINLTDAASKGRSGGVVYLNSELKGALLALQRISPHKSGSDRVIQTERGGPTSAQVICNWFWNLYSSLGYEGCSSHSGRRTFITAAARKISQAGGSMRDVQALARHSSLAMTQRYIECDSDAQRRVVDMI